MLLQLKQYFLRVFSLDYRGLAILRIVLWIIIIYDVALWIRFLTPFHTDLGVMPLDLLRENYPNENIRAFHSISNNYIYQSILFGIHMLIAVLFTIWRRTKEMTVLVRLFTCSVMWHNPQIINGADVVVKMFLFWGMFLPLGARRSIDHALYTAWKSHLSPKYRKQYVSTTSICSAATVALILQLCVIYVISAILKDHPIWNQEFTATYYALSLDTFVKPLWSLLYQFPEMMKWMTAFSLYLERWWVFLLLIPRRNKAWRMIAISLFIIFHLGLHLTMRLETFPRVMISGWLALIPSITWDRSVYIIQQRYTRLGLSIHLPSYFGLDSGIISNKKNNADAVIIPDESAAGKIEHIDGHDVYIPYLPWYITTFVILCLAYVMAWNIRTTTTDFAKYDDYFPRDINRFWFLFRLDQYRNMFSPFPFVDDGWTVIVWTQKNGNEINALHPGEKISFEKPAFDTHYEHEKRRKIFTNLWMKSNSQYRWPMAQYFCHKRNSTHTPDQHIKEIKRYYVLEKTLEDYKTEPLKEVLLYEWDCESYTSQ